MPAFPKLPDMKIVPQTFAVNPSDGPEWIRCYNQHSHTHYFAKKSGLQNALEENCLKQDLATIIFGLLP
jgi:hypothetical protein